MPDPRQGEVWTVDLEPTRGHEQGGHRPCLVVSRDEANESGLYMVVPGTTKYKKLPGRVCVPQGVAGLDQDTFFQCAQVRTVSEERFSRRIGSVERKYLQQVLTQVGFCLSLPPL
jgi:mRNA interferase MazF